MLKKFNKKGFTLIELLAVIVILAIVAAVTMTVIVPMLSSKPGEAAVISVKDTNKAIVNACTAQGIDYSPYGTLYSSVDWSAAKALECETGSCTLVGTTLAHGQSLLTNLKINGDAPSKFKIEIEKCRITNACYTWANDSTSQFKGLTVRGTNESVTSTAAAANDCQ